MFRRCLALALCCTAAAGCASSGDAADGPRMEICGSRIGQAAEELAGSGPWFVDLTERAPRRVVADAQSNGTWLRLTNDCRNGVRAAVTDRAVITISDVVKAKDGAEVAVLVQPVHAGTATLSAERGGRRVVSVSFAVAPPFTPPSVRSS